MTLNPPKESVLDRFLRYVKIDTQSDEDSKTFPSTEKQWKLLRMLHKELGELGVEDADIDKYGYVTGTVPSNLSPGDNEKVPTLGFFAHVDTAPQTTGTNVKPQVHKNYQGGDIVLPGDPTQIISPDEYPNLENKCIGMDIVTSDGTTLLGADDKAGVAEVMTAIDMFRQNPEIRHGRVRVAFNPDEEVGRGMNHFDVEKFGAKFAYTMDGSTMGEIEFETFNAFGAVINIQGVAVHPGYAKDKLVNAIRVMADIVTRLPADWTPEATDKREGYIFPYDFEGGAEHVRLKLILRDFEMDGIDKQKELITFVVNEVGKLYPKAEITLKFKEQYRNMRYLIEKEPRLVEYAKEAIRRVDIEPYTRVIRGGTDGARLTYMGLPTPNIFAGGEAFHSKIEWVPVQAMEKAAETIIRVAEVWVEKSGAVTD